MAYRRRYGRRVRRYTKGRTLSKASVYSRTGAKSQARQIYALKRRVSRISRELSPETKVFYDSGAPFTFTMNNTMSVLNDSYTYYCLNYPGVGAATGARIGNKIRIKTLSLRFQIEYQNNSNTGYQSGDAQGTPIRFIVLKTVGPVGDNFTLGIDKVLAKSGYTGANYTAMGMSPFVSGLSEQYKVMYDRVEMMSVNRSHIIKEINIRNQTVEWTKDNLSCKFLVYIVPSGLHTEGTFTETIKGTFIPKIAYTDI